MTPGEKEQLIMGILAGTAMLLLLLVFIIAFALLYQRRRNQHAIEMTQLKLSYDQELLKSQLEIQEQTFRSISQEIHDNIGQVLSLAKLNVGIVVQQAGHIPMLHDIRTLLSKAINDLRDLSKGLSPERVADIDLAESIGYELAMLERTGIYTTSVQVNGSVYALPKEKKVILFRIFQELINNVVKHSGAGLIDVKLAYAAGIFELTVADNGSGFDVSEKEGVMKGIGFYNMQNRSALIGARFDIRSDASSGTSITIALPVSNSRQGL